MAELERSKKFYGYAVAVGCAIIVFCTQGALGTFGVFFPYILASEGYSPTAVSLMATCCSTVVFVVNTFFYSIVKKLGAKNTMLLGCFCCALHYVIYGLSTSIPMIYVGACVGGIAMGCATNAIVSVLMTRWFIEKRDQIVSIAMLPMAFGGAAFAFICGQLIELTSWRTAYFIMAAILVVITIPIGLILIKESPEKYGQLPLGGTEAVMEQEKKKERGAVPEMKTAAFWLLWVGLFILCLVNPGLSHNLSNVMRGNGIEPLAASNLTTVAKLCGAFGFLLLGALIKKIGGKGAAVFFGIVGAVAAIALMNTGKGTIWIVLMCLFYGLSYPEYHLTATYVTTDAFGRERFARLFGILQGAAMWAGAFGGTLVNAVFEAGGKVSYHPAMVVLAVLSGVGAVLILLGSVLSPKAKAKRNGTGN